MAMMNGIEIYNLRKTIGINQQQFADMVGIAAATVHRWETGKSFPKQRHLPILKSIKNNYSYVLRFKENLNSLSHK